jgi:hypothetical protein
MVKKDENVLLCVKIQNLLEELGYGFQKPIKLRIEEEEDYDYYYIIYICSKDILLLLF